MRVNIIQACLAVLASFPVGDFTNDAAMYKIDINFRVFGVEEWYKYGTAYLDVINDSPFPYGDDYYPESRAQLTFKATYSYPIAKCLLHSSSHPNDHNTSAIWSDCLNNLTQHPTGIFGPKNATNEKFGQFRLSTEAKDGKVTHVYASVRQGGGLLSEIFHGRNPEELQEVFSIDLSLLGVPLGLSYELRQMDGEDTTENKTAVILRYAQPTANPFISHEERINTDSNISHSKPTEVPQQKSFLAKYWWAIIIAVVAANFLSTDVNQNTGGDYHPAQESSDRTTLGSGQQGVRGRGARQRGGR